MATSDIAGPELKSGQDEARALLGKAGYTQKDGKAVRDGKPLTLTLPVPTETPSNDARVKAIVADLKAVGITVKTPTVEASRFFRDTSRAARLRPRHVHVAGVRLPGPTGGASVPSGRLAGKLHRRRRQGPNGPWGDASATLDDAERADRIHDLDARLIRQAVVIPLAVLPEVVVVKDGLVNYGAATFERPDFTTVGFRSEGVSAAMRSATSMATDRVASSVAGW